VVLGCCLACHRYHARTSKADGYFFIRARELLLDTGFPISDVRPEGAAGLRHEVVRALETIGEPELPHPIWQAAPEPPMKARTRMRPEIR
jgi:hypothetical protein